MSNCNCDECTVGKPDMPLGNTEQTFADFCLNAAMSIYWRAKFRLRYFLAGISIWFWSKFHPCRTGFDEYDHDLVYVDDTYGAYDVIGGICVCGHWECEKCGHVPEKQAPPPTYDDFDF